MKRIAAKLAKRLKKNSSKKMMASSEYIGFKDRFENIYNSLPERSKLIREDDDIQHAVYSSAQNLLSLSTELMSDYPEFDRHTQITANHYDNYMPSWPPLSPISNSYFSNWQLFDLQIGLDKESFTSCLLDLSGLMKLNGSQELLYSRLHESRMGIYKIIEEVDDKLLLEELYTGKQYLSYTPNLLHACSVGDLWFVRLLPPINESFDYYIIFGSPYVLRSSQQDWYKFFDRNIQGERGTTEAEENYQKFMKNGLSNSYWLEFVMQAYSRHTDLVIYLTGVPDIANSRPHSREIPSQYNRILPEALEVEDHTFSF